MAPLAVTCLLVLPALVAAVSLLGRHWYGSGDQALEVLRIGDVGGQHTPLVGVVAVWLVPPRPPALPDPGSCPAAAWGRRAFWPGPHC